ncbi:MAG TPA: phage holin family protein [Candidatus Saccharimonadales bacterium]|nr:phage holin family protein [Candidatus Saccharimonadales bacterium]
MQKQFLFFLLRWLLNGFAIWVAARLLSGVAYDPSETLVTFLLAGLLLTVVNVLIKPILLILSLPAIVVSLGLFMLIVNGFLVWLVSLLVPDLEMSFWSAVLAGIIVSVLNFVFTLLVEYDWEGTKPKKR